MDRRTLIGALALGLFAAPWLAQAQPPARAFRIGMLGGSSPASPGAAHIWGAFLGGLRELG
jgi:hypothetical protein